MSEQHMINNGHGGESLTREGREGLAITVIQGGQAGHAGTTSQQRPSLPKGGSGTTTTPSNNKK